ncbi:unnamed protein product [Cylicocyclus nassatus]|uniref:Uncharacterized protein n=1 Tax=Cylicocyclus nassatus TaxID=53992 RepID=A0AA36MEI5_CYLNA|nr:unnamed protein product [Cylicocyclus nassatus]
MSAIRGPRYQQQQRKKPVVEDELHSYMMPLEHHDDNDGHEMYSMPYYEEEEAQDDYERKTHAFERSQRAIKEQRNNVAFRPERHVARIEITNGEKDGRNDVDCADDEHARKSVTKIREVTAVQRSFSEHRNGRVGPTTRSSPPPPPAPNMRTPDKINLNKVVVNVQKQELSVERKGDERYKRSTEPNGRNSPAKNSPEKLPRSRQDHMAGKMVVVHMERAPQTPPLRATESRSSASRRPSTNPFAKGAENRRENESDVMNQQVHNVQEVVQRMNSGDWPIKIDEEEHENRDNQQRREREPPSQRSASRAHNWETLKRDKPMRESDRQRSNPEQEQQRAEQRNHFENKNREIEREQPSQADETGYRSDSSDQCEHTTVSTDSAFASEGCVKTHQLDILGSHKVSPGSAKHLDEEARKLLLYFKSHRMLLNYLGIGLTETLWHYISALPMQNVHISVAEEIRPNSRPINGNAEAYVSSHTAPSRKSPPPGNKSPRLVALERQLRTDDLANEFAERSRGYSSDGEGKQSEARGGRFVKKSAAALIAKKQGYALQNGTDEPNSSEIVDPRIASEIRALREREDELRRSRTELGLPTLDDVMRKFDHRAFTQTNLRSARSYDQLHQIGNEGYYFRTAELIGAMFCAYPSPTTHHSSNQQKKKEVNFFVLLPFITPPKSTGKATNNFVKKAAAGARKRKNRASNKEECE